MWQTFVDWFLSLGERYGVNPLVFGAIYVGAIPLFTLSSVWLVRNARRGRPVLLPALSAGFWFISAYLYLLVAGRNVPWWVYVAVVVLIVGGGYSAYSSLRKRLAKSQAES